MRFFQDKLSYVDPQSTLSINSLYKKNYSSGAVKIDKSSSQ